MSDMPAGHFKPGKKGTEYSHGKLYRFNDKSVDVLSMSDGPRAWVKTEKKPYWKSCYRPSISQSVIKGALEAEFHDFDHHWMAHNQIKFFRNEVPGEYLEAVAPFRHDIWQILSLAMRADGLDLIRTNPGLAYIVALNRVFFGSCRKPWRRARSLTRKKRVELLRQAGFPASASAVKTMGKLDPAAVHVRSICLLKKVMKNNDPEVVKMLRFLPRLNRMILFILNNPVKFSLASYNFLEELGEEDDRNIFENHFLIGTFRMANIMERTLPRINSLSDIRKIHDRLVDEINSDPRYISFLDPTPISGNSFMASIDAELAVSKANLHKLFSPVASRSTQPAQPAPEAHTCKPFKLPPIEKFPAPPIAGYSGTDFSIEHIKDAGELREWAIKQHNCSLSYAKDIWEKKYYFYRITAPENATLSIRKGKSGQWAVDQIKGTCNKAAALLTVQNVNIWITGKMYWDTPPEKYLLPGLSTAEFEAKPLGRFKIHDFVSKYSPLYITPMDLIDEDCRIFFYRVQRPEKAILGLKKISGQWENIFFRLEEGNRDPSEKSYQLAERWLKSMVKPGVARQLRMAF